MQPPAIVGIVGKSKLPDDSPSLTVAATIGRRIAEAGHIVMTGGYVHGDDPSVKHHALVGAIGAADAQHPVRVVGILPSTPEHPGPDVETWTSQDGAARISYLYTELKSSERDLITGGAPDVVIALPGTGGTAKEVAAAFDAGRPVVFVGSVRDLKPLLQAQPLGFHVDFPTDLKDVSTADAVETVLDIIADLVPPKKEPRWITTYPGLTSMYDDALREMGR